MSNQLLTVESAQRLVWVVGHAVVRYHAILSSFGFQIGDTSEVAELFPDLFEGKDYDYFPGPGELMARVVRDVVEQPCTSGGETMGPEFDNLPTCFVDAAIKQVFESQGLPWQAVLPNE